MLQLQRTAGNHAVAALLRQLHPEPVREGEAETAAGETTPGETTPGDTTEAIFEQMAEPVELGGEQHRLSIRTIDEQPEIGVESKWTQLRTIDEQIRLRVNVMGSAYPGLWRDVQTKHNKLLVAKSKHDRYDDPGPRLRNVGRNALREKQRKQAETELRMSTNAYTGAANRFLRVAYDLFGEQVAMILGALTPTHEKDPLPTGNYAGKRYHEGTAGDPIPIIWYKPANAYPQLTLQNLDAAGNPAGPPHVLNFPNWPATPVNYRALGGAVRQARIGIDPNNQVMAAGAPNLFNNHPVQRRDRQQELNLALISLGFPMGGLDGDHVRDLGFSGTDTDDNFWPLNSVINQNALIWRRAYRVHFKQLNSRGQWELKSRPIEGLHGKWFRVKGAHPGAHPPESSLPDAGQSTGWGASTAGGILINGVPHVEP